MSALPFSLYGDLLTVPYLRNGRTLAGLDCVGVFLEVQRRLDRNVSFYGSSLDGLEQALGEWEKVSDPQPGDGILIHSYDPPWHVGVVLDIRSKTFIHGKENVGVVVERYDQPEFHRRVEGFYSWKIKASVQSESSK